MVSAISGSFGGYSQQIDPNMIVKKIAAEKGVSEAEVKQKAKEILGDPGQPQAQEQQGACAQTTMSANEIYSKISSMISVDTTSQGTANPSDTSLGVSSVGKSEESGASGDKKDPNSYAEKFYNENKDKYDFKNVEDAKVWLMQHYGPPTQP